MILRCKRCVAVGYGACDGVFGGALLEEDCPAEEPPAPTALVLMYVGRVDG